MELAWGMLNGETNCVELLGDPLTGSVDGLPCALAKAVAKCAELMLDVGEEDTIAAALAA